MTPAVGGRDWLRAAVPAPLRLRRMVRRARARGEPELRLVPDLCVRDRVSLDIGANNGIFAFDMRAASARVMAFEPNPTYAHFMRCALKDVEVVEAALSDRDGRAVLHVPRDRAIAGMASLDSAVLAGIATDTIDVALRAADGLGLPPVGFMKIDVEGHELAVLHGAAALIGRDRPNILVEAEEVRRPGAVATVRRFLADFSYDGVFVSGGAMWPVAAFDPARHQDRRTDGGNPYVNNFIFCQPATLARLRQQKIP